MIERGGGSGLVDEALSALFADRSVVPEQLDGDGPSEAHVDRTVDDAHAAFTDRRQYLVMRQRLRRHRRDRQHETLSLVGRFASYLGSNLFPHFLATVEDCLDLGVVEPGAQRSVELIACETLDPAPQPWVNAVQFMSDLGAVSERSRMVDQNQVPVGIVEHVSRASVSVTNQIVEHPRSYQLVFPIGTIGLARCVGVGVDNVFYPQLGGTVMTLELPFHGGGNHVHLQELVDLVGGDFGFVALSESPVDSRRQRSPNHSRNRAAGAKCATPCAARAGLVIDAHALGGPQVLLDFLIAADPNLGARSFAGGWLSLA